MEAESCPPNCLRFQLDFQVDRLEAGFHRLLLSRPCRRALGRPPVSQWQPNLDLQAALWAIAGLDGPTVEADSALGDGEPQPYAAGLAAAGIINAIERPEKLVQRFLGHAGTRIHDSDNGFRSADCRGRAPAVICALVPSRV